MKRGIVSEHILSYETSLIDNVAPHEPTALRNKMSGRFVDKKKDLPWQSAIIRNHTDI